MGVMDTGTVYESIVYALSQDYFDLYYVDVETEEYVEYGSRTENGQKATERRGSDFFGECQRNAASIVYSEDLERVLESLAKPKLLAEVERHGACIYHYRLLIDGVPTYVSLKATRVPGDDRHIVIGISNVDTQVKDRMAAERSDPQTNEYTEFSTTTSFDSLGIAKQGPDFFASTYANSLRTIHIEDQELFHSSFTKENVLAAIEQDGVFALNYRLVIGGTPTYVMLKAVTIEEDGKTVLLVGLFDENTKIRKEREYARNLSAARQKAVVDALTGVKNKHAYVEWEERIDAAIKKGEQEPFAVVICDINGLKEVNDLYGHKEGDACIKRACRRICNIFSHSPVFRIGGDEFAVILTKGDYEQRVQLMSAVLAMPDDCSEVEPGNTIAAGMAEYDAQRHTSFLPIFEEADKAMYKIKKLMKESGSREGDAPEHGTALEQIPAIDERKCILVADDIALNREALGDLLKDDYDVIYASDGIETLEKLHTHKDKVSLVLLDLYMPRMTGREVIAEMQIDDDLMSIPVVFLTVDQDAELDCLRIGAMDFIPKPYPDIEIVKARIAKCIELSEDRDLIRHTERDRLTGLLNRDFFFRYVERLDRIHDEDALDALVCDINKLHSINKHYGRQFGDHVLHCVGAGIRKLARKTDGIGCREGGDTFYLYCPHRHDYEQLINRFLETVFASEDMASKVSMRFGVFSNAQQEPDVEERFVRAKTAADSVKHDPQKILGYYAYESLDANQ